MASRPPAFLPLSPTIITNRKIGALAKRLGIFRDSARILMENIWLVSQQQHPDGQAERFEIEIAISTALLTMDSVTAHQKQIGAAAIFDALVGVGFVDHDEGEWFVFHGWEDHGGKIYGNRVAGALATARSRAKKKGLQTNDSNVTVILQSDNGNGNVIPNINLIESNININEIESKEKIKIPPAPEAGEPVYEPAFLNLWKLHPQGGKAKAQKAWIKSGRPEASTHLQNYLEFCHACNRLTVDLATFFGRDQLWREHGEMQPVPAGVVKPAGRQTEFDPEKY